MATDDRRIQAIRRLIRKVPHGRSGEYLTKIEAIATGKADAEEYFRAPVNANLTERLAAAMASVPVLPGAAPSEPEPEPEEKPERKRKAKSGRNRMEADGENRGEG